MSAQRLPDKNFDWAPDLAYTVGLIVTDGSLSKDILHSHLQILISLKHLKNV